MRIILFIFFFFCGFSMIQAKTISIEHNPQKIIFSKIDKYDHIEYSGILNGSPLTTQPGAPDLPFYVYRVLLQPGETIQSFSVSDLQQVELKGQFNIMPRQKPWAEYADHSFIPADANIYKGNMPYPKTVVQFLGVQHFNGRPIAHFAVWPLQYLPASKKLLLNQHLIIQYKTKKSAMPVIQPFLKNDRLKPENFSWESNGTESVNPKQPLPPSTDSIDPALLSSGLIDRYVIITTDALKEALQPLAEWKIKRGVPTVIKTLSWIRQNFNGVDDAERMRNFIRWSYHKRGTKYVLLAGDTEIIPTRLIYTGNFTFAADYYFADLDGSWNANQNDVFGQAKDKVEA